MGCRIREGNDEEVPGILCHQKYLQPWLPRPYGQNNVKIGKSDGLAPRLLSLRTGLVLAPIALKKKEAGRTLLGGQIWVRLSLVVYRNPRYGPHQPLYPCEASKSKTFYVVPALSALHWRDLRGIANSLV